MEYLPQTFELLLWNMQKCRGKKWRSDFLGLIHGKHLVLLQEASLSAVNLEIFDQNEEYFWVMARSFTHIKLESENGVKTGSRCQPLDTFAQASPNFEPLVRTHKMMLETSYPLQGCPDPLKVFNIHALNFSRSGAFDNHIQQVLAAAKMYQGPMILAGDFNTWSKQRYSLLKTMVLELGLIEAEIIRKSKARHLYKDLDHLFYRGLKLDEVSLMEGINSSDHLPITARFSTI